MPHRRLIDELTPTRIKSMADEKKIIVDEDWKSQVQAEKEQAAKAEPGAPPQDAAASTEAGDMPMPPASFELLLTMLATEALVALGQVPHPITGKAQAQRNQAKYLIDMIEVLRDKTKGNLTTDEQQLLESLLHQLRLVFVETAGQSPATTTGQSKG
jgi:hypothetical protein